MAMTGPEARAVNTIVSFTLQRPAHAHASIPNRAAYVEAMCLLTERAKAQSGAGFDAATLRLFLAGRDEEETADARADGH